MSASSTGNDDAEILVRLEQRRYQALIDGDFDQFAMLLTDDFVYHYAAGGAIDKTQLLEAMKARVMTVEQVMIDAANVRVHGDVAVVMGRLRSNVTQGAAAQRLQTTYLHVWLRSASGWKLSASQHTYIPEAEPA